MERARTWIGQWLAQRGRRAHTSPRPCVDDSTTLSIMSIEVQREIHRSRRHGHPFALIRFVPSSNQAIAPGDVAPVFRLVDRTWNMGDEAWALLPETDAEHVLALFARLRDTAPHLLRCPINVALFPDDGTTLDDLLACASGAAHVVVVDLAPVADNVRSMPARAA